MRRDCLRIATITLVFAKFLQNSLVIIGTISAFLLDRLPQVVSSLGERLPFFNGLFRVESLPFCYPIFFSQGILAVFLYMSTHFV